jgi:hypothetical protein
MAEAYCLKCRAMREIKNSEPVVLKNHRRAVRGRCSVCGNKLFRLSPGGVGMKNCY